MDNRFVVYKHFTKDTNELFYIGEGTKSRAFCRFSRNKFWKHKVEKHGGFTVELVKTELSKIEAEELEKILIEKYADKNLTNLCKGTMFGSHWLIGKPKEMHPMFGTKRPEQSARITKWNKDHSGVNSPTYGLKRPDLALRNKLNSKNNQKKIICVETQEIFNSVKEFKHKYNNPRYAFRIKNKLPICGLHFEYLLSSEAEEEQNTKVV